MGSTRYGDAATKHVRYEYAALLSMCDRYLGKVLDMMDKYDLWKDTHADRQYRSWLHAR